ncbi:MAG: hypothetical protein K940chlam3_00975 [Chlamydiae bacterium]|nr:hypothetical protein [Chlamydiota bacterium]
MKKSWFAFIFLILVNFSSAFAGDFYGIIIADTEAENIGDYVHLDYFRMSREMAKIAENLDRPFKQVMFTGNEVDGNEIVSKVNQLDFQEDDIVFFYFTGHGQRAAIHENDPWPLMLFSMNGGAALDFSEITSKLLEKKPQLLLAFADCCNLHLPVTPPLVQMAQAKGNSSQANDKELVKENIRQLFEKNKGMIMVSSSEPGESAWSCLLGSYYTMYFINYFQMEIHEQAPSWEVIFEKTARQLDNEQHPQYLIIPSNEEAQMTLKTILSNE